MKFSLLNEMFGLEVDVDDDISLNEAKEVYDPNFYGDLFDDQGSVIGQVSALVITPQAEEKMEKWHLGLRRENVKACSDNKLLMYVNICDQKGYTAEAATLRQELLRRNIQV